MILSLVLAVTLAQTASPEIAVLAAEHRLNEAVAAHDRRAAAALIETPYTLTTSSGKVFHRDAFLDAVADRSFVYSKNNAHDQEVTMVTNTVAVVTGILDQEGTQGGKFVSAPVRYTDVWVNVSGDWVEAAGQATRAPAQK